MNQTLERSALENVLRKSFLNARIKKDTNAISILSLVITEIDNEVINNDRKPLSDKQVLQILRRFIKRLKESIEIYTKEGKEEQLQEDLEQLKLLESFLPKQLSNDEVKAIVKKIIDSGVTDFGKIMRTILEQHGDQVEARTVSEIIKNVLSNN